MKKALFVTLLCLSSMTFAETIKKEDYVLCKKPNGDRHMGYVSSLFKDGSLQISHPSNVNDVGLISQNKAETLRLDANNCKVLSFADEESSDYNKPVICNLPGYETIASKILGVVASPFKDIYVLKVNTMLSPEGDYDSVDFQMVIDKKNCSIDETVEELNVNGISRSPGKEVPEVEGKIKQKSKASKQ